MTNELPLFKNVHALSEVVHGTVVALRIVVERRLHELAVFKVLHLDYGHVYPGDDIRLSQNRRLNPRFNDLSSFWVLLLSLEHRRAERAEWEERVVYRGLEVRWIDGGVCGRL